MFLTKVMFCCFSVDYFTISKIGRLHRFFIFLNFSTDFKELKSSEKKVLCDQKKEVFLRNLTQWLKNARAQHHPKPTERSANVSSVAIFFGR